MKNKISKFSDYNISEASSMSALGSKARRIVTGQSAGEEIHKLSDKQQNEIQELYEVDPMEAARYLRSIIIKEKNSQFGLGLALTIAGAAMIYKASQFEPPKKEPDVEPPPPPPPPPPPGKEYIVQKGDSFWKIAKETLPPGSSNKDILAYTKQLASDNGAQHLYSGKFGSPGLKADSWYDFSGNVVSKSDITGADKLVPGETLKITPFSGN